MGVLTFSRQIPRGKQSHKEMPPKLTFVSDKWEWGGVSTRILGGTAYAMLSFFNLKSGRPLVFAMIDPKTGELITQDSPSIIWQFAGDGWM